MIVAVEGHGSCHARSDSWTAVSPRLTENRILLPALTYMIYPSTPRQSLCDIAMHSGKEQMPDVSTATPEIGMLVHREKMHDSRKRG